MLLAADGIGTNEIVRRTGVSKPTVIAWKKRYAAEGIGGLEDRPKPGKPRTTDDVAIVLATLEPPPERLGVTHWSSRLLAAELGLSNVKVAKVWREYGLQPWRAEKLQVLHRPATGGKAPRRGRAVPQPAGQGRRAVRRREIAGPGAGPDRADAAAAARGSPRKQTHDYIRHGTTTLFAALEVATGKVTDACYPRHRHEEFLRFLRQVAKAYPRMQLHIVVDNYATHKHPDVQAWLAKNPRITLHFTPTSGSWLNMVEIFFGDHHPPGHPPRQLHLRQRPHQPRSEPSSTAGTTAASPSPGPRPPTSYSRTPAR